MSRVHFPLLTLGHGTRAGVWTQGCTLRCEGCVARDTWDADAEMDVPVAEVLDWLARHSGIDGVTISGGEPLDQPEELYGLLRGIRDRFGPERDILCFTGRTRAAVNKAFSPLLALVDALVAGPFDATRPTRHPLMGSGNQELVLLTELGRQRYGELAEAAARPVQAAFVTGGVRTVGIPNEGDLTALASAAADLGLLLIDPTWEGDGR